MPTPAITAYILAGGRSSRMGRDKAMLPLAGRTLLAHAVATLRTVAHEVVLLGDRRDLQGADRAIPDLHPGFGPVGGMETALRDLDNSKAEWACFLPVDMPFLPADLYAALLRHWLAQAPSGLRVGYPIVDGILQPLISLLHVSTLPAFTAAVESGDRRVAATLDTAAKALFPDRADHEYPDRQYSARMELSTATLASSSGDLPWQPSPQQLAGHHLWFSNLNTPEEFEAGESFLRSSPRA